MRNIILFVLLLVLAFANTPVLSDNPDKAVDSSLEQELEAARADLREAARRLAELSGRLGEDEFHAPVIHAIRSAHGPRLGIGIRPSPSMDGIRVEQVFPGSAAETAGLEAGDVIRAINGQSLDQEGDAHRVLAEALRQHRGEEAMQLEVERDGQRLTLEARPGQWPALPRGLEGRLPDFGPEGPGGAEWRERIERHVEQARERIPPRLEIAHWGENDWMRVRLVPMNAGLGEYFGTREGVLVLDVPADSELGLAAGDVILRVDGQGVDSPREMIRQLRGEDEESPVTVTILRQGEESELELPRPRGPLALLRNLDFMH